ncbi:uncharacterized protein Tco025E_08148 [Trypanosoma conorhini]|uniref:Uncharacterized protein n=1 Tax=Trypanosoma conorhini TaxID=83891 RepID=A0A3R7KMS1_9TRYP|nr:uncharacterized protein Tco025E_08148 [Trypanosoma conorhini]RNF04805.1 hypothetical protein Tco025E_08148 [Trypanosoma conorhini]
MDNSRCPADSAYACSSDPSVWSGVGMNPSDPRIRKRYSTGRFSFFLMRACTCPSVSPGSQFMLGSVSVMPVLAVRRRVIFGAAAPSAIAAPGRKKKERSATAKNQGTSFTSTACATSSSRTAAPPSLIGESVGRRSKRAGK